MLPDNTASAREVNEPSSGSQSERERRGRLLSHSGLVHLLCGLLTFLDEDDWPPAPAVSLLAVLVAALLVVPVAAILVVLVVVVVGVGA